MGSNRLEKNPVNLKSVGQGLSQSVGYFAKLPASRTALSADCKFTCHYRCRALVCLDCCGPRDLGWDPALERDTNVVSAGLGEGGQGGNLGLVSPQQRCSGLIRALRTVNVLIINFLAPEFCSLHAKT